MKNTFFIGMLMFFCTTIMYVSFYRDSQKELLELLKDQEKCLNEHIEVYNQLKACKNYPEISFIQNDIINGCSGCKRVKSGHKRLELLTNKIK